MRGFSLLKKKSFNNFQNSIYLFFFEKYFQPTSKHFCHVYGTFCIIFVNHVIDVLLRYQFSRQCWLVRPILAQCSIITLTFIGLTKHLVIGQLNEYQFFSAFHWSTSDTPLASQCITRQ